ncbi:MAG: hypothetical protein LIO53_02185 [Oscillospiraceae bacterium]|nr:hypothetical protein [Oscillospiraceae bacterium]
MQKALEITVDKKKIISKPFDFEAMCIINDAHNDESKKGPLNMCRDAVDYMFEGTDATQSVIDSLDIGEHARLCTDLWKMYIDAFTVKNE